MCDSVGCSASNKHPPWVRPCSAASHSYLSDESVRPQIHHQCLFHRQLLQFGEGAGEQANQEGGGTADDVNHGGREDRNEGVLPGEGVEQGHHRMGAAG